MSGVRFPSAPLRFRFPSVRRSTHENIATQRAGAIDTTGARVARPTVIARRAATIAPGGGRPGMPTTAERTMSEDHVEHDGVEASGADRRSVLKKLGVGAAVAWTVPVILTSP